MTLIFSKLYLGTSMTIHFQKHKNQILNYHTMHIRQFGELPLSLECHLLFEWFIVLIH